MLTVTRWCFVCVLMFAAIKQCAAEDTATPTDDAATINRILADWKARWERVERVDYRLEGTRESGPTRWVKNGAYCPEPGAMRRLSCIDRSGVGSLNRDALCDCRISVLLVVSTMFSQPDNRNDVFQFELIAL